MFGVLFESRARRQRRSGGVALSVAAHMAVIGAATVATAAGKSAPLEKPKIVIISLNPPPHPAPPAKQRPAAADAAHSSASIPRPITVTQISAPTDIPLSLPAIDLTRGTSLDSIVIGSAGTGDHGPRRGILDGSGDEAPSGGEWRGTELLMRIVSSAKPRYPESLRQAGIDGRVLVRFTVDTLGRVETNSIQILQSTHDLFTRAVRDVLPSFRFKPSEVHGKRVESLAEMPFEFAISR